MIVPFAPCLLPFACRMDILLVYPLLLLYNSADLQLFNLPQKSAENGSRAYETEYKAGHDHAVVADHCHVRTFYP
jgi:hypothetical protein